MELLSPGGNFEKMKYAIAAGADAVYISGKDFGARKFADNFTIEEMSEAIEYAHLRDVKVYVTINTLILENELQSAYEYAVAVYNIGADAIIVQDIGLADLLAERIPEVALHASTQASAHTVEDVKALKNLGFKRVVLARENTLSEITQISEQDIETEVFIHGAHCISYSGQCLMSSLIGFRSGNRGTCAQPCRKKYTLVSKSGEKLQISGEYLLSPKDMESFSKLSDIEKSGVDSLKIEGRMKSSHYAYLATKIYKDELNGIENEEDRKDLEVIFSRGYTKGRKFEVENKTFMNYESVENKGLLIGKITDSRNKIVKIRTERELFPQDELKAFTTDGSIGGRIERIISREKGVYTVKFSKDMPRGKDVYISYSEPIIAKIDAAVRSFRKAKMISGKAELKIGTNPKLTVTLGDISISHTIDMVIEKANTRPFSQENAISSLSKTKDTIYEFNSLEIVSDEYSFVPASVLNELRREALDKLHALVIDSLRKPSAQAGAYEPELTDSTKLGYNIAQVYDKDALEHVLGYEYDYIYYCDVESFIDVFNLDDRILLHLPNILKDKQLEEIDSMISKTGYNRTIVCSNLGQVSKYSKTHKVVADHSLNVTNSNTIHTLEKMGSERVSLSVEMSEYQLGVLASAFSIDKEMIVYGRIKSMTTEHCPFKKIEPCSKCVIGNYSLHDSHGEIFPIRREPGCRNAIFFSKPINLLEKTDSLINISRRAVFVDEDSETIRKVSEMLIEGKKYDMGETFEGHYNRRKDI